MKNPCTKNCPDRTGTCHAECEAYLEYAAWCNERRKNHMKSIGLKGYIDDAVTASLKRKGK